MIQQIEADFQQPQRFLIVGGARAAPSLLQSDEIAASFDPSASN
jgi:hypothetical protein